MVNNSNPFHPLIIPPPPSYHAVTQGKIKSSICNIPNLSVLQIQNEILNRNNEELRLEVDNLKKRLKTSEDRLQKTLTGTVRFLYKQNADLLSEVCRLKGRSPKNSPQIPQRVEEGFSDPCFSPPIPSKSERSLLEAYPEGALLPSPPDQTQQIAPSGKTHTSRSSYIKWTDDEISLLNYLVTKFFAENPGVTRFSAAFWESITPQYFPERSVEGVKQKVNELMSNRKILNSLPPPKITVEKTSRMPSSVWQSAQATTNSSDLNDLHLDPWSVDPSF